MTRQPKLEDYQVRFVQNVARVLGGNFLRRCPAVRVLDMGCDCSGRQLAVISQLVRGEVVGINIPEGFPSPTAVATAGDRVRLLRMDGMQLDFPDASFDVVISANVIEHVPNVARFVAEAARVLKPGGICYMETAPVWTSARGHHLMESMVAENIPEEAGYRDDGSVIPEWGHLSMTREQMAEAIGDKVLPKTREYLLRYLYDSRGLNKTPWSGVCRAFRESFAAVHLIPRSLPGVNMALMPSDGREDYSVYGFSVISRKGAQSWLAKRLYWRLRRVGL